MTRVLYISYDGLLEPLGFSQVFRYLERLARSHEITLISFEKPEDLANEDRLREMRRRCETARVRWVPLRYHKRPTSVATAMDIVVGTIVGVFLSIRYRIQIVHARSYVSSVMAIILKRICRAKFIFDMRGFWADERVEGGLWQRGSRLYRISKWFERKFLRESDAVVSLTAAAVSEMETWSVVRERPCRFFVIPTCADVESFSPRPRVDNGCFVLGYVGSVGLWYEFDPVLLCFKALCKRVPRASLLVLNRDAHEMIRKRLSSHQIDPDLVTLQAVTQEEIPSYMAKIDASAFFVRPTFSKKASAPTKFAELLACGIPSVVRGGIGDMDAVLDQYRVGVSLAQLDSNSLDSAMSELLELLRDGEVRSRCRQAAVDLFSLETGVSQYDRIYELLAGDPKTVKTA